MRRVAEQQPPPPDERARQVAEILAAVVLASTAADAAQATASSVAAALRALTRLLTGWGWRRATVLHTIRTTTTVLTTLRAHADVTIMGPDAPALRRALGDELTFAGWFLERTGTRVEAAGPDQDAIAAQVEREGRFLDMHERAQEERRKAAEAVDREAAKPGTIVVEGEAARPAGPVPTDRPSDADRAATGPPRRIVAWVTVNDDRTTPECAAADGCWFYADTPPLIGYPGQPHGGTCRCVPGPATRAMFLRGRHVNEATARLLDHRAHPGANPTDGRRPGVAA